MRLCPGSLLFVAVSMIACPEKRDRRGSVEAPQSRATVSREEACIDRWLADHDLDTFGSAPGTTYGGGTPLFDERTGIQTERRAFVYSHHPEARKACAAGPRP